MNRILVPLLCAVILALSNDLSAITIPMVPVGNPGNAADANGAGLGHVAYMYFIGEYEVTNDEYAAFLNAKAGSDPLGLYNPLMNSNARGGITQGGVSPNFNYAVKANMGNKPVNYVSWYDALRFVNWLTNGQGSGDTETGSYPLLGGTPVPTNNATIARSIGASWFLTNNDEWHKAAYHQPFSLGGDTDNYWSHATRSNNSLTWATADAIGNISNPGADVANVFFAADWNGQNGNVTTAGSAGPLSRSFYGTSDQNGNIFEWMESRISDGRPSVQGGSWSDQAFYANAGSSGVNEPTDESPSLGFRVMRIPEPTTLSMAVLALCSVAVRRRRVGS